MSEAQVRNILWYIGIAVAGAILATGVQLGAVLSGTDPIEARPLLATFIVTLFAALSTAAGASFRPKAGREDISGLVSDVGSAAAKSALEDEAVRQATGNPDARQPLTAEEVDRISDALLKKRAEEIRARFPDARTVSHG